jgi:hypothetical protein
MRTVFIAPCGGGLRGGPVAIISNQARPKLAQLIVNPVPSISIESGMRRFHMPAWICNERADAVARGNRGPTTLIAPLWHRGRVAGCRSGMNAESAR